MTEENQNQNKEENINSVYLDDDQASEGEFSLEDEKIEDESDEWREDDFNKEDVDQEEIAQEGVSKEFDMVELSKHKLALIKKMIAGIQESATTINQMLSVVVGNEEAFGGAQISSEEKTYENNQVDEPGNVIEGVFDGEKMVGPDGKQYTINANYCSKSKLVEGDMLKLIITDRGHFVYKLIGPVERSRVIGVLGVSENGHYIATGEISETGETKTWLILKASVTYFKGEIGDELVLFIPKSGDSAWAAVENIIKKGN